MEQEKKVIKLAYIGMDKRYFENLKLDFESQYEKYNPEYFPIEVNSDISLQNIISTIEKNEIKIVYIDFSSHVEKFKLLLEALVAKGKNHYALVALYPQLDHDKVRPILMSTNLELGIDVNVVKTGNNFIEPIYLGVRIAYPQWVQKPKFFEKKYREGSSYTLFDYGKINYICDDYLRVETNLRFPPETEIQAACGLPMDIVESQIFISQKSGRKGCRYNRRYTHELIPLYLDHIEEKENMNKLDKAKFAEDTERRDELIESKHIPEFKEWIAAQIGEDNTVQVRVGIIEQDMTFIELKDNEDRGVEKFHSKSWAHISEKGLEVLQYDPHILVIELNEENNLDLAKMLMGHLKDSDNDTILVLFNCKEDLESVKAKIGYQKVLLSPGKISAEMIELMALKLIEKAEKANEYIVEESHPLSKFFINQEVKVFHMSENSIDFELEW